jgi:diguanylate cyclase (GGDEF)-like protein
VARRRAVFQLDLWMTDHVTVKIAAITTARVSRRELAQNRYVWLAQGVMFAGLCVVTAALAFAPLGLDRYPMLAFAAVLGAAAATMLLSEPPSIGSAANHVALASTYVGTGLGVLAFHPDGIAALPAAMFIGPLTAARLVDRREIVAHYLAASVCLIAPVLYLGADYTAFVGLAAVVISVWGLGASCILVLEASEAQGEELENLVRRDPLTGLGNRRLLTERLAVELPRHGRVRRPLSVIALDLRDFKGFNETHGYDAGDALLQRVGATIGQVIRPTDLVVRTGGDRFVVLLPNTTPDHAHAAAEVVRRAVADAGPDLVAAVGVASYPRDAVHDKVLLHVVEERLAADQLAQAAPAAEPASRGAGDPPALAVVATAPTPAPTAGDPGNAAASLPQLVSIPEPPELPKIRRVSRRDLAENRAVWLACAGMYAVFSVITLVTFVGSDAQGRTALLAYMGYHLICMAFVLRGGPPAMESLRNHIGLATVTGSTAVGLVTFQPNPEIAIGVAMFIGPLTAIRVQDRRAIFAHYGLAGTVLTLVAVGGVITGEITQGTVLAITLLIPSIWAVGTSCVVVLEAAEAQGYELERLVRRDPLTGVGNRRLLAEHLADELLHHDRTGQPLSVVAVNLDDFRWVNEKSGQAAGDELLRVVAETLAETTSDRDIVVRLRGDEFCLILENTSAPHAVRAGNAIRAALAKIDVEGRRVTASLGVATFPDDATDGAVLLHVADERLAERKRARAADSGSAHTTATPGHRPLRAAEPGDF